ncbi:MAG: hypothetical protein J5I52_01455 [Saprospiraceae bacterium]|nr:hypothetical protein [Saprospiraceae bacterium]MCZ2339332.1 hypothetical protein [Chitinophagales bacterium]
MKAKFYSLQLMLGLILSLAVFKSAVAETASPPLIMHCPPNVYVSCTDELWDLSIYGNATYSYGYYTYNCGNPVVEYHLNSCNAGYITRTWMVEDYYWNWHSCTQTIYVSSNGSGTPDIQWPDDIELDGCDPDVNPYHLPPPNNFPTWTYSECGMLGRSYSDMEFYVNSQCRKIMRTWKIMDWCDYSPSYGYKIYTHVQILYLINRTEPVYTCPDDIVVGSNNCKNADVVAPPLEVDPSVCGGNFIVTNDSPYSISKGANISGQYPIGTTKVTYTIKYACGKTKKCHVNVIVKNEARPTPICIGKLVTALMPVDTDGDGKIDNGMVEVWAKTLDQGSFPKCGYSSLSFSFSQDVKEKTKIFTCEDVGLNKEKIWVTDSKGGQNYCEVDIIVQNNNANIPDCEPKPVPPIDTLYAIKGNVLTLTDTPVHGAEITAEYKDPIEKYIITYDTVQILKLDSFVNASGYTLYRYDLVESITQHVDTTYEYLSFTVLTDEKGNYLFDSLPHRDKPLNIFGSYTNDAHQFIDAKDVGILDNFIKGNIIFPSYYQYVAADINEDGVIDENDLDLLKDFVDGTIDTLVGNQWFLLDKNVSFTNPEDVLNQPLPLVVSLDSIASKQAPVDFVAVKKGNLSVDPGSIVPPYIETRSLSETGVKAWPNPFNHSVQFVIKSDENQPAQLRFMNISGQIMMEKEYTLTKGTNIISVDINSDYEGLMLYQWLIKGQPLNGKLTKIK